VRAAHFVEGGQGVGWQGCQETRPNSSY
jgi:hypothetical protein